MITDRDVPKAAALAKRAKADHSWRLTMRAMNAITVTMLDDHADDDVVSFDHFADPPDANHGPVTPHEALACPSRRTRFRHPGDDREPVKQGSLGLRGEAVASGRLDDLAGGDPGSPPVADETRCVPAGAEAIRIRDKTENDHQLVAGPVIGNAVLRTVHEVFERSRRAQLRIQPEHQVIHEMGTLVGVQREVTLLIDDLPRQRPQHGLAIRQAGAGRFQRAQHDRGKRAVLHRCDTAVTALLGSIVFVLINKPRTNVAKSGATKVML